MGVHLQAEENHNTGEAAGTSDRAFMERALELARRALGHTSPNPVVGAVVVRDGIVVGEGFHRRAGSEHAEVEAIRQAGEAAAGATLYVTLEPCNHVGRTGPCTGAILAAGVKEVFFAVPDPMNHGTTRGRDHLLRAGLIIHAGLCEKEARYDNRFFLHASATSESGRRPWVIAKFACSLDGRIATATGESQWITGEASRRRAHELRALVDAVAVGSGTVLADDPQLTVRLKNIDVLHPTRIVLDGRGRTPPTSKLLVNCQDIRTIIATTQTSPAAWREEMSSRGAEVLLIPVDESESLRIPLLLTELGHRDIQSMMVEGGATVLGGFFDAGLVDEVWAFVAPMLIGGEKAPGSIAGRGAQTLNDVLRLEYIRMENLGADLLIRGLVQKTEVPERCLQEL